MSKDHTYEWMSNINGHLWITRILFATKCHTAGVERISTRPISMILSCASLEVSRSSSFYLLLLCLSLASLAIPKSISLRHKNKQFANPSCSEIASRTNNIATHFLKPLQGLLTPNHFQNINKTRQPRKGDTGRLNPRMWLGK